MPGESFEIIDHPERFIAGEPVTISFRYVAGEEGLAVGSKLKLGLPSAGWGEPLVNHKRHWEIDPPDARKWLHYRRLNTTFEIESATGAFLEPYARHEQRPGDQRCIQRWWITFEVIGADMAPGDTVTIVYGDTTWGETGCAVQPVVEPKGDFSLFVQPPDYEAPGDEGIREVPGSPVWVAVEAGPPTRALLRLPTISAAGDALEPRVYPMDRCCNPAQGEMPTIQPRIEVLTLDDQLKRPAILYLPHGIARNWHLGGKGADRYFAVGAGIYLYVTTDARKMFERSQPGAK